mmetsp:Transcript_52343/g.122803  ORF Transcript_52343/g.122803 Transcript_52343/m.122803 type:complete len:284 (+) Transcript_52343:3-854(+)
MSVTNILNKSARARRLFNAVDCKCLNVAIDHGIFNEGRFLPGIEDMPTVLKTLCAANPDAIQLTIGQARELFPAAIAAGCAKVPALVVRCDVANVYGTTAPPHAFCDMQNPNIVEEAVRLDATGVICNLLKLPDDAPGGIECHRQCIQNVAHLRAECTKYNMPLLVEPLAFKWASPEAKDKYAMETDVAVTQPLVRLACELGADIIKCDPPADTSQLQMLIDVSKPRPVLLRGGDKGEEAAVLATAAQMMQLGAAGLVYGRNIIHHQDPSGITKKFMDVIHKA